MPRPHPKSRKNNAGKNKHGTVTVHQLVLDAQQAAENFEVEKAVELYRRALKLEPNNYNLMDALADLCLQVGEADYALHLLTQSTNNSPESNPIKWMYLAQLLRGEDAVRAYRTGIDLLSRELQNNPANESKDLRREIISAYCGIAELYMTDLCFEPNAEESCETAIMNALVLDNANAEALQTLASLRISQCRKSEAAEIIAGLYRKYDEVIRHYQQRTILDEMKCSEEDMEKINSLPTPEHCVSLVKLLLECVSENEQTRQHFPIYAEFLLQFVLQFDDENPEVWYLLGMSNKERVPAEVDAAVEAFVQCKTLLTPLLQQLQQQKQRDHVTKTGKQNHNNNSTSTAHAEEDNKEEECAANASSIETLLEAVSVAEKEMVEQFGLERIQTAVQQLETPAPGAATGDEDEDAEDAMMTGDEAMQMVQTALAAQKNPDNAASVFQFSAFQNPTQATATNNNKIAVSRAEEEEDNWSTDDDAMDDN